MEKVWQATSSQNRAASLHSPLTSTTLRFRTFRTPRKPSAARRSARLLQLHTTRNCSFGNLPLAKRFAARRTQSSLVRDFHDSIFAMIPEHELVSRLQFRLGLDGLVRQLDILAADHVFAFPTAQFERAIILQRQLGRGARFHLAMHFDVRALVLARNTARLRATARRGDGEKDGSRKD